MQPSVWTKIAGIVGALLLVGSQLAGSPRRPLLHDPRTAYDVLHYALDLRVDPGKRRLTGTCTVTAKLLQAQVDSFVLDAGDSVHIQRITLVPSGAELTYVHRGERLAIALPQSRRLGDTLSLAVTFQRTITEQLGLATQGIGLTQTPDGAPWVSISCQLIGAHSWWPCKASFFHPEDKADSVRLLVTAPDSLFVVSNGRFVGVSSAGQGWETYRWVYSRPISTYLVAFYVGPYVDVTQPFQSPGDSVAHLMHYYVLRSNEERAKREFFSRIPREVALYERLYGPFPFWSEKLALVQSPYPGMEHSTAVAVGPIFPHTLKPGDSNPLAWYENYFNYMAVHELAHEWWGNAVTAADWGEFWLHEAFATYTEALWVEHLYGPEILHQYMAELSFRIDSTETVYRPRHRTAREAYHLNIYWKGAWVLHMLRYVMGDSLFFRALRDFNTNPRYRYHNASTSDFQRTCERLYGDDLSWFFLQWVYRPGHPRFSVTTRAEGSRLIVTVLDTSYSRTRFRMPLDLLVHTQKGDAKRRLWVNPGKQTFQLRFDAKVLSAEPTGLRWILDGPKTGKLTYFTDLDFIKGTFVDSLMFTADRRVFVGSDSAAWESPPRSLFRGARWLRLRVDASHEPRYRHVRLLVRRYNFLKRKRTAWVPLLDSGAIPDSLQTVRRLQYRLEFGQLVGDTLTLPRVILEYGR